MNKTLNSNLHESAGIANEPDSSRTHCDSNGEPPPTSPSSSEGGGGGRQRDRRGGIDVPPNNRLPLKEYWKKLEAELLYYWIPYPARGRTGWETCKMVFHKMRRTKTLPDAANFYGIVRYYVNNIWDEFVPNISKFFNEADWRHMSAKVVSEIKRDKEHNQREVERLVNEFKGNSQSQEVI